MDRFRIGILIIMTLISLSCFSQTKSGEIEIPLYFPVEKNSILYDNLNPVSFLNICYSKHLFALHEPILFSGQFADKSIYRMTVLRTFANPYAIRIENNIDTITLYWKECDGSGGYEPGNLIKDKKIRLTINDWKTIEKCIAKIDLGDLPKLDNEEDPPPDGTSWAIEELKEGRYKVFTTWNPKKVSKIFNFLVNLTDIDYTKQRD